MVAGRHYGPKDLFLCITVLCSNCRNKGLQFSGCSVEAGVVVLGIEKIKKRSDYRYLK